MRRRKRCRIWRSPARNGRQERRDDYANNLDSESRDGSDGACAAGHGVGANHGRGARGRSASRSQRTRRPSLLHAAAAPQGARRRLERVQCRRRAEVGLHLHGGTARRRLDSGRAPRAVPGPRRHRPRLVRELRHRALDRSAVPGPQRNLHPPDHALRGRRIRQHAGAAELRSRRAGAPRREQRHGRSGRAADAEVLRGGRRPHRRDALRRRRGIRRRPPAAHARPQGDRLQRRRPPSRDAAHDGGRPLRAYRRRVQVLAAARFPQRARDARRRVQAARAHQGQRLRRIPPVHPVGRGRAARVQRPRGRSSDSRTRCSARPRSA